MEKKYLSLPLILAATFLLMFSSCKKTNDIKDLKTDDSFSAEDNSFISSSMNSSIDEAAEVAGTMGMAAKAEDFQLLCGASLDLSNASNGVVVINYTGAQCFNVKRTGSITLTLEGYASGIRWNQPGAILDIDFDLTVTRPYVTQASSFTISGRHTLTNVTGGIPLMMLFGLNNSTPVTYRHTATDFTVNWSDGSQRIWSVNRLRTFASTDGNETITTYSDHTENGIKGAESWGTNQNGNIFMNAIIIPIVSSSRCGLYKPVSGEFAHMVADRTVDVFFGVDKSGNPVAEGSCAYGYKLSYTAAGATKIRIVSY